MQSHILHFYHAIKALPSLTPSPEVNQTFHQLCRYAQTEDFNGNEEIFSSPEVQFLRFSCAQAEYELEKKWTNLILDSEDPRTTLQTFPYFNNYQDLTRLEFQLLKSQKDQITTALFVGSGPLPLSAILLAKERGVNCILIDRSQEAVTLSQKLISKLSLQGQIQIIESDFSSFSFEAHFDVVMMASLLFDADNQETLLSILAQKLNFDLALLRSAEGMRQLLYQKLDISLVKRYLSLQFLVHPHNDIVNSVLLCSKR